MFDKLKNLDFKIIAKFFGLGILILIFLVIAGWLIGSIFGNLGNIFNSNSSYNDSSYPTASKWLSFGWEKIDSSLGASDTINYTENSVPSNVQNDNYDVKSYNVTIDSNKVEKDCNDLVAWLKKDYIKKDNISQSRHYCSLSVKVLKWKESEFIAFLQSFKINDLQTNITNIVKSYVNLADKIDETKKRLAETEAQLQQTKTSYDELWNALKNKNISAESIDALNKIILNKSELIAKFSKERETLVDSLNSYTKQKQDYDEQIKYIDFYIQINEKIIFDWENIKEGWYNDYKELVNTFNETFKNLSVNLVSFLLKTVNFVVYAVLSIFLVLIWGKWLYRMWRRIIYGKEEKRNK